MINVNQITSQLAKMPDQALQQYAAMHKNDPYTMALALAESNRRKELRAGAHMNPGQQPKVVDQEIAQMSPPAEQALPEDVGIAQLPTENIQGMAGGGIVAFEEGGEVPRYYDGALIKQADVQKAYADWMASQPSWWQQQTPTSGQKEAAAKARYEQLLQQFQTQPNMSQPGAVPAAPNAPAGVSGIDLGGPGSSPATTGAPITPQGPAASAAPTQTPTAPAPTAGGIAGGFEKKFLDMLSKGEVSKEDRLKEMTDINKPVLEKMTTLIDEQKSKLKTDKEENFYMALIQGGLAAAGGNSPNALQNIAQGFEKGAANYGEGLKDLRKAAQENRKMELSMAEYEASGKKEALKSFYDHQDKMQGFKAQGLASIMGHEISAAASASHAGAQERLIDRIGRDPKFADAYARYQTAGAEAKLMPQLAAQYAKDPMKLEMLKQTDPLQYQLIKSYLNQQMVPGAVDKPTGNVRP